MSTLSPQEAARLVEFGEAGAWAQMYAAAPPTLDLRLERIGNALLLCAPDTPGEGVLNRVVGLGVGAPATPTQIDDCIAFFRDAGNVPFAFQISPRALPPALPNWLEERGYVARGGVVKMIRPAAPVTLPTELRVERIDRTYAADFGHIVVTVFGLPAAHRAWMAATVGRPGWHHYLAFADEVPVAAGALFVRDAVGWLGAGSTLPEFRRRGAQGAIMARRTSDAAELGCRWVITETGEDRPERPNPSYHNMIRTGFSLVYKRANYVQPVPD